MKKFFKIFYSSKFVLAITFLLNVAFFAALMLLFNQYIYSLFSLVFVLLALFVVYISNDGQPYKLTWMLVILLLPLFGVCLYFYIKASKGSKRKRKAWQNINFKSSQYLQPNQTILDDLQKQNLGQLKLSNYILNTTNMPVYQNTTAKYLADGEHYFNSVVEELKKAEKYIFIESYIIDQGRVWDEIFNILKIKARQGVEVKILYDDWGCLDRFEDSKTFKKLANFKIEAVPFNKITPALNAFVNYRNHRKIIVVDGRVGFTGGINIGDEYCNYKQPFGTWKDSGIMLNGDAVWSLVVLFLNNWQFATRTDIDVNKYKVNITNKRKHGEWIQPFGTSPLHAEPVARNLYISMLNNAQKSMYITTPYFILDDETTTALKLAAKSGVDVRIIFPGIPDQKIPYYMARQSFADLIKCGIKIYEYTPGFIHSKVAVVDGKTAVVGTINWDFRSLYLHFEDAVMLHNGSTVEEIKFDYERTLNNCHMITLKDMKSRKWYEKVLASIFKFFAPLF